MPPGTKVRSLAKSHHLILERFGRSKSIAFIQQYPRTSTTDPVIQEYDGTIVATIKHIQVGEFDALSVGKAKGSKEKTINIDIASTGDHIVHGDSLGNCM